MKCTMGVYDPLLILPENYSIVDENATSFSKTTYTMKTWKDIVKKQKLFIIKF